MDFNRLLRLRTLAWVAACCTALAACEDGQGAVDVDVSSFGDVSQSDTVVEDDYANVMIPVSADAGPTGLRLLPNATALAGDNFILVQAARGFGGPMSLDQALRSAAPLPAPFEYAISSDFTRRSGLAYLERTPTEGVTCVLAFGSSASATGRRNPVIMRNCVNGGTSLALAPIASIGGN